MAEIKLTFNHSLNTSLQVGDTAWYVPTIENGGYKTNSIENIKQIGPVVDIQKSKVFCNNNDSQNIPLQQDFIMFSKNNKVNESSLKGYYAEVKLVNDSTSKIELFSVSSEIVKSSK